MFTLCIRSPRAGFFRLTTTAGCAAMLALFAVSGCGDAGDSPGADEVTAASLDSGGVNDLSPADEPYMADFFNTPDVCEVARADEALTVDSFRYPDISDDVFVPGPDSIASPDGSFEPLQDPGTPGGLAVFKTTHELELESGGLLPKTASMTIYLPSGEGPYPVLVFNHGFQLGTDLYASYGTHLASWGFVVVMPQMPGGLLGGPSHAELSQYLVKVLDWVQSGASALQGKADAKRIGLAGHSMGGKISMLTATADPRPAAVFGVDPVDAVSNPMPVSPEDYPSVTPELMHLVTVPVGLVGETTNGACSGFMCQACAPEEDNFHQYYEHASGPAIEIEVLGANHVSFLDDPACGLTCSVCPAGTDDPATTRLLTRRYMTAFFNEFLGNAEPGLFFLTGPGMDDDSTAGLVLSESKNGL